MYFGTQYYRPPFPGRRDWAADLEHIKKLNFNVVKIWAVWNWIEKSEGEFDFTELDEIVAICKKQDLKVIVNTIPEGAPAYTRVKYQDALYRKADGTVLDYSGPANIPSAGWPGLCQDSPKAGNAVCKFIYETARHFAKEDQVIAIDIWNEPHLEPSLEYSGELICYCDHSKEQFLDWLKKKYETIEGLNQVWFRNYTKWDDIIPPIRFGTAADMIDWKKFWLENLAKWMRERAAAARNGAPEKIIQSHVAFSGYMGAQNEGGLGNELGDEFLLAKEVDVFGLSSFPLWLMGAEHQFGHFINAEITAEAAREKAFYQTELQGGAGKAGLLGGLVPTGEDIWLWNWNVLAAGGKGVVYWQYAPEPAGLESPGFGLVDGTDKNTARAVSAGTFAEKYNTSQLDKSKRVLPVNGILLSRDSDLWAYSAMEERQYANSFKGVYRCLYERGIPVRFVHEDYIDKLEQEGLKVLYVPMGLSLSEKTRKGILTFIHNGGTLIAEGPIGMYKPNGETNMQFEFLKELLPVSRVSIDNIREATAIAGEEIAHVAAAGQYRTITDVKTGVTAYYQDKLPAIIENACGKGKIIWFSEFLGKSYWDNGNRATGDYLAAKFIKEGYAVIHNLQTNGAIVRLLETESEYLVIIVNHAKESKSVSFELGTDLIQIDIAPQDGELTVISKR